MQDHKPLTILDRIREEIQAIFLLVDEIPYSVMSKIIGLNSVLVDQKNSEDKQVLKKIASRMRKRGVSEDILREPDILERINKLNKMMFSACLVAAAAEQKMEIAGSNDNPLLAKPKSKKVEALGADDTFPMLVELMQRNQGKNRSQLLKMHEFCSRLAVDIGKTEYEKSEIAQQLGMFLAATQHVLGDAGNLMRREEKFHEKEQEDDDFQLSAAGQRKEKIKVKIKEQEQIESQKNMDKKIEMMAKLPATQLAESKESEVSLYYFGICEALKKDDIPGAINLLAKLGELASKRWDVGQQLVNMSINDKQPINLLIAINELNEKYGIFSNPLLVNGYEAFKKLMGSYWFEKEAKTVPQSGFPYLERVSEALFNWDKNRSMETESYEDPVSEALFNWGENRLMEAKFYEDDPMLNKLEIAIQGLKKEADNFESSVDKLRVITLANKLHESLERYANSTKKDKSAMVEMQNEFREAIDNAGLLVQPPTFREKISHILLTIERMIKEKLTNKKESRYKFYSAKKQLSDKLGDVGETIKNIEAANDPIHPTVRISKK